MGEYDRKQRNQLSRIIANNKIIQREHATISATYIDKTGNHSVNGVSDSDAITERKMRSREDFGRYFFASIAPRKHGKFHCAEPNALSQIVENTSSYRSYPTNAFKDVLRSVKFAERASFKGAPRRPCATCAQWVNKIPKKNLDILSGFINGFH